MSAAAVVLTGLLGTAIGAEPILRIDAGMHTAPIRSIAVDVEERYLVTASDDKTARVWELSTGRLLRTLRPPIANDRRTGRLFAVAMTPDGNRIACGGYTRFEGEETHAIYVFDRQTGRLLQRVAGGLPGPVADLAYSPDGKLLAAALSGGGIRFFAAGEDKPFAEDGDYQGRAFSVSFAADGRLVSAAQDGVRLYDAEHRLIAAETFDGRTPGIARFSPDGAMIAVGFADGTDVAVYSGSDLSHLYSPSMDGVEGVQSAVVAWSGDYLYTGGRWEDGDGRNLIRRWDDKGRGASRDLVAAEDTIMDLHGVAGGGVVFGAADPAFGVFGLNGERLVFERPPTAILRANWMGFRVSADARQVDFGFEIGGAAPARFSIDDRRLELDPQDSGAMLPPRFASPSIRIVGWRDSNVFTINGLPYQLENGDTSRSLAVAHNGETFILGTEFWLLKARAQPNGEQSVEAPAPVRALNIAANDDVAVAAFGDGSIRWYRMSDFSPLLSFFPHRDRKRWVLWTPSGYYDAYGGEDLIGWHINRGVEEAPEFHGAAQFRDAYYRPDVVALVLETKDESEALALANDASQRERGAPPVDETRPPVVEIVSPANPAVATETQIEVAFVVRSSEPVTTYAARVDQRPAIPTRGVQSVDDPTDGVRSLVVPIPPRDSVVTIVAENRHGAGEATLLVNWSGSEPDTPDAKRLFVLGIGVGNYSDKSLPPLKFPAKDASDFVDALMPQQGRLYRRVVPQTVTEAKATKEGIVTALVWLEQNVTRDDTAMVLIAGHGVRNSVEEYNYLPYDADISGEVQRRLTALTSSDLATTAKKIEGRLLFFVDTCRAGHRELGDINKVVNELMAAGAVIFPASTGTQVAHESSAWQNGAFTKAVVEGLSGQADKNGNRSITFRELDIFVSDRVAELTNNAQKAEAVKPYGMSDFVIAAVDSQTP